MNKKNVSTPITLDVLTDALDKQNKKLTGTLDKRDNNLIAAIRAEIKDAGAELEYRLEERFTVFSDKLFTMIDPILKEIVDSREDRVLASDESEEFKRKLGNHEKRIVKLEEN